MPNEILTDYEKAYEGAKLNSHPAGIFANSLPGKILGFDSGFNNAAALRSSVMQNAFNSSEAAKNRHFQERMSNTANSRAVADLKNAGFSPLALFGHGSSASTPSGAVASGSGPKVHGSDGAGILAKIIGTVLTVATNSSITNARLATAQQANANIQAYANSKAGIKVPFKGLQNMSAKERAEMEENIRIAKTKWLDDD